MSDPIIEDLYFKGYAVRYLSFNPPYFNKI